VIHPNAVEPCSVAQILVDATPRRLSLPERGVDIALLDWGGTGPLVLLHHANGFCKGVWGLVADALRHDCRVVAMDARGHGDSSRPADPDAYTWSAFAEDVAAVAARLAAEQGAPVALGIGHSFGGTAMLSAAARHHDRFDALLLVDPVTPPPPSAPPPPGRGARTTRLIEGARKRRSRWPSSAAARAHFGERSLFARCDPRALDLYVADGLRTGADGAVELKCSGSTEAAIFAQSGRIDVFALAREVITPTVILWATDGDFPRAVYETIAGSMRTGRVDTVDTGHLVPLERPDLVVDAARRLLPR
jgi:pimeloyl-ACP methyl ester carboxylesterase